VHAIHLSLITASDWSMKLFTRLIACPIAQCRHPMYVTYTYGVLLLQSRSKVRLQQGRVQIHSFLHVSASASTAKELAHPHNRCLGILEASTQWCCEAVWLGGAWAGFVLLAHMSSATPMCHSRSKERFFAAMSNRPLSKALSL
jgi:hypothetical protein